MTNPSDGGRTREFSPGAFILSEQRAHGFRAPGLEEGQAETTSQIGGGDAPEREPEVGWDYL